MTAISSIEWQLRADLAAAFRVFARLGFNDGIANHNSAMLPDEPGHFLVNPRGMKFDEIRASDLIVCDLEGLKVRGSREPRATEMRMHGRVHAAAPRAAVLMHVHARWTTALSLIEDGRLESASVGDMILIDRMVDGSERNDGEIDEHLGDRIARCLGENATSMLMHRHGLAVSGPSIADAFDELYCLERQGRTPQTTIRTSGKTRPNVRRLPDNRTPSLLGPGREPIQSGRYATPLHRTP